MMLLLIYSKGQTNMDFIPFDFGKRQEEFINNIIIFVYNCLTKWRDDPMRPNKETEKRLNPDLPKFLTSVQ